MYKLILLFVLLYSLTFIWAQEPISMRNVALGNVIDGDWENIYDPIELNFYNQQYFFTNLSDYKQQVLIFDDDLQFIQESEFVSEFPFGFTFKDPFLEATKHSFLIRFKDNQMGNLSNGFGESETINTNYYDSNMDWVYDTKEVTIDRSRDYTDMNSRLLLLLNTSVALDDNILGLRFSWDKHKDRWDNASMSIYPPTDFSYYLDGYQMGDHSEFYSFTRYDLEDNIRTLNYSEDGDFKTTSCSSDFQCLFSFMNPTDFLYSDSELRYDLSLNFNSEEKSKTEDDYYGQFNQFVDTNTHEEGSYKQEYNKEFTNPRNEVFLNAKYRHNLDTNSVRLKQSFWEVNLGLGCFGGDYENDSSFKTDTYRLNIDTTSVETKVLETNSYRNENNNDGSYMGYHAKLYGRSSVYFSDYVCFGYGVTFDLQSFDRETDNHIESHTVDFRQIGTEFDTSADFITTSDASSKFDQELTQTTLQTVLPVGLEFSLPKNSLTDYDAFSLRNFTFRLGTVFIHELINIDSRSNLDGDVQVGTTIAEYGDGHVDETHPTDNTFTNHKDTTVQTKGTKRFTAGIGYNHSDNFSIDLGSYIDSTGEDFFVGLMFTVKK